MSLKLRGEVWWMDATIKGKRERHSLETTDKGIAKDRYKQLEQALWEKTVLRKADKKTLDVAFREQYKLHWSETKDAKGVASRYETMIKFIPKDTWICDIDQSIVNKLVISMKDSSYARSPEKDAVKYPYSLSTINRVLALLGVILKAEKVSGINLPKFAEIQTTEVISYEEERMMFDALATHDNQGWQRALGLFEFLVDTGCRMGEALGMEWHNVDLDMGAIFLKDTKSGRDVAKLLTTRAIHVLQMEQAMNITRPFAGLNETTYRNAWNYAKEQAGISKDRRVVRHTLRHTAGSRIISAGNSVAHVKQFLGHQSSQTSDRYIHLDLSSQRASMEALTGADSRVRIVPNIVTIVPIKDET